MKRRVLISILFLACVVFEVKETMSYPYVLWGSNYCFTGDGAPDIYDKDGNVVSHTVDWCVQVVRQDNGVVVFQGPPYTYGWDPSGEGYPDGIFAEVFIGNQVGINGVPIFTRIWDSNTPGTGWYADVGFTTLTWSDEPPTPEVKYNFGKVYASDWQPIPEPAASGLMLVGLSILIVFRKRFSQ